jgi:hypothetical protein
MKCVNQVNLFVNEYPISNITAPGNNLNGSGPSCQAARAKIKPATIVPIHPVRMGILPVTSGLDAVRGFRASIQRSASRFVPIAKVRAEAMATVIQKTSCQLGHPLAARSIPR